jgi:calcium-dependent protein kinase
LLLLHFCVQVMQEQEWQSYVDQAFNRMDLDGDGFIDLDELLSELPAAYFSEPSSEDERIAEAKRMLREADENGDGRISKQVRGSCIRFDFLRTPHAAVVSVLASMVAAVWLLRLGIIFRAQR